MESYQPEEAGLENKNEHGLGFKGVIEVLYQPARFFERMKNDPKILVPWIVFFLLIATFFFLVVDLVVDMQMNMMREKLANQGLSASNLPTAEQMKWSTLIFGPLAMMLAPLVAAALALFFGNTVMAGRASFKQLLSVMLYGEIIIGLGAVLLAPLMVAKGSMNVSISLAALLQNTPVHDPLYVALSKIGAFYIWEIIVVGIGLSIIYGFSRNKGYTLAVLSMGMLSILHALSQLAFG